MSWDPIYDGKPIASGGGPGAGVRLADISGSGKADYLFVGSNGAVQLYKNGGPDPKGAGSGLVPLKSPRAFPT